MGAICSDAKNLEKALAEDAEDKTEEDALNGHEEEPVETYAL